jgi:hypothetical protein
MRWETTTMADQAFRNTDKAPTNSTGAGTNSTGAGGFDKAASSVKSVADQAVSAGRDLKNKAADTASSSTEAIKDRASEFVDAAKDVASQASDRLMETIDGQKTAGAEYVGSLADTMRRAAREFDKDLPIAGTYIRKAAAQVETVSDSIKNGNFDDLVRSAQSFARRQPTAFLGIAVLAGFGAVRFLKSSAETTSGTGSNMSRDQGGRGNMQRQYRSEAP